MNIFTTIKDNVWSFIYADLYLILAVFFILVYLVYSIYKNKKNKPDISLPLLPVPAGNIDTFRSYEKRFYIEKQLYVDTDREIESQCLEDHLIKNSYRYDEDTYQEIRSKIVLFLKNWDLSLGSNFLPLFIELIYDGNLLLKDILKHQSSFYSERLGYFISRVEFPSEQLKIVFRILYQGLGYNNEISFVKVVQKKKSMFESLRIRYERNEFFRGLQLLPNIEDAIQSRLARPFAFTPILVEEEIKSDYIQTTSALVDTEESDDFSENPPLETENEFNAKEALLEEKNFILENPIENEDNSLYKQEISEQEQVTDKTHIPPADDFNYKKPQESTISITPKYLNFLSDNTYKIGKRYQIQLKGGFIVKEMLYIKECIRGHLNKAYLYKAILIKENEYL